MKKIVFMGTPDFSVPILNILHESEYSLELVVTQPDRIKGRKKVLTPPPVKKAAEDLGYEVFQPESIKDNYQAILDVEPDMIVTAAYGQILPEEILEKPEYGCINVHASLLPELRGGAPIHYAILQGKAVTGVTIMYMVSALDAGDIISQIEIPIEENDDVGILHDKLSLKGSALLKNTIPKIFHKEITPIEQDESLVSFARNIKREQERIDWKESHIDVYNHIRGLRPWPVAFTTYKDKPMKIWQGEKIDIEYSEKPGMIVDIDEDGFMVVCGNQKGIKVTEIQPAGKKRMTVKNYLNGAKDRIQIGEIMGD